MAGFAGTETQPLPLRFELTQETDMDSSVHQARWMLAPVLALCIVIVAAGLVLS
jgi:hypothetical protein